MDIARDICTDSFYIVNSGLPCIPVTAVDYIFTQVGILNVQMFEKSIWSVFFQILKKEIHCDCSGSASCKLVYTFQADSGVCL